ncbi:MAG: hypothetical protein R3D56_08790 [Paracoccaceae bacterium]
MRMTGEGGGEFPHEAGIGGTQFGRLAQPGAIDMAMQRKGATSRSSALTGVFAPARRRKSASIMFRITCPTDRSPSAATRRSAATISSGIFSWTSIMATGMSPPWLTPG